MRVSGKVYPAHWLITAYCRGVKPNPLIVAIKARVGNARLAHIQEIEGSGQGVIQTENEPH